MILVIHLIYICCLQEHWLFSDQLHLLSLMISFGVSGMDDSLLRECPFGGCAFIYNKSLSHLIYHHNYLSNKFCAISLFVCNVLICV